LELFFAASLVAGLVLTTVRGQQRHQTVGARSRRVVDLVDLAALDHIANDAPGSADLPCPWCLAPTREDDTRCASCGQRFG
jgi:hypothetical protein